jgi:hypothetical protein
MNELLKIKDLKNARRAERDMFDLHCSTKITQKPELGEEA